MLHRESIEVERGKGRRAALIHAVFTACICAVLGGCAAQNAYRDAREMLARDQASEALAKLEEAVRLDPTSAAYRIEYLRTRERLTGELLLQANAARGAKRFEAAEAAYRKVLSLQPGSEQAIAGIRAVDREQRWQALLVHGRASAERKDLEAARSRFKALLMENPDHAEALHALGELEQAEAKPPATVALAAAYRRPISLEFKDVPIKTLFELISKSSGMNFLFDKDVRTDQKASVFLRNSTIEAAVSRLLITNQLEQRVLDENTVLIYPDTPAKQKDYQLLTVKSFYLSNSEAKTVGSTLKAILKAKDVVVDDRLNLVILRDTPEVVRLAEKLVALQDVAESEVMLDVEIVEVKRSSLLDLGVRWPDQIAFAPLVSSSGTQLTLSDLRHLNASRIGVTVSPLTISASKNNSDANILANPRIRSKNKEKARILIGDRVPNITTTSTSSGFISDSVNYIDVGLKLEVEPTVYPDGNVAIKLSLEVSNLVSQVQTKSGTLAYQIGTRNVSTMLRLKDGENQILAGLINDEDRRTAKRIPGLGDIPLAGRLFGGQADDSVKTEIVLSITPRIIRSMERPERALLEFDSGTEASLKNRVSGVLPPLAGTQSAVQPSTSRGTIAASVPSAVAATSPRPGGSVGEVPAPPPNSAALTALPVSGLDLRLRGPTQVRAGQSFTVDVLVEPRRGVVFLPLTLGFDPLAVQVLSVDEGEFMNQGGAITQIESRVDGGEILANLTRSGAAGAAAPGRALSVRLLALGAGRTTAIKVLAVTPQGEGGAALNVALPVPLQIEVSP